MKKNFHAHFLFKFVQFLLLFELGKSNLEELLNESLKFGDWLNKWRKEIQDIENDPFLIDANLEVNNDRLVSFEQKLANLFESMRQRAPSTMYEQFERRMGLTLSQAIAYCEQLKEGTDQFGFVVVVDDIKKQYERTFQLLARIRRLVRGIRTEFGTYITELLLDAIASDIWVVEKEEDLVKQMESLVKFLHNNANQAFCKVPLIETAKEKATEALDTLLKRNNAEEAMGGTARDNGTTSGTVLMRGNKSGIEALDAQVKRIAYTFVTETRLNILEYELIDAERAVRSAVAADGRVVGNGERLILIAFFVQFDEEWEWISKANAKFVTLEIRNKLANLVQLTKPMGKKVKKLIIDHLNTLIIDAKLALKKLQVEANAMPFLVRTVVQPFDIRAKDKLAKFNERVVAICEQIQLSARTIGIPKSKIGKKISEIYDLIKTEKKVKKETVIEEVDELLQLAKQEIMQFVDKFQIT